MSYELQDLSGKVVVITGATSGIGRETARGMVAQGAQVVLNARKENDLKALCKELTDTSAIYVAGDCSDPEVSRRIAAAAVEKFGTIDILVPNAGVGLYGSIFDWSDDEINSMIRTNFEGTVHLVRGCAKTLVEKGAGDIIIVCSVAGYYGAAKEAVYAGTKHAQVGLAAGLDRELREKGIRVSLVAPAGVSTNFAMGTGRTPGMPRLDIYLKPEEVASQIIYIARQPRSVRTTLMTLWSMDQQSS
ncbi:MAG: SDR family oxidoreductase [Actinomycetes bacterium]